MPTLTENINVVHKLETNQFTALLGLLQSFVNVLASALGGDDPAKLAALTDTMKKSSDALADAINQAQQPKT